MSLRWLVVLSVKICQEYQKMFETSKNVKNNVIEMSRKSQYEMSNCKNGVGGAGQGQGGRGEVGG